MSQEEIIEQLEGENERLREENRQLRAENHSLKEQMDQLNTRVQKLEGRVAKDSHKSSKPPSSDGYARKTRSLRQKSGKKPGGQAGHAGSTLSLVETPDEIIVLRTETCAHCQANLQEIPAEGCEGRQLIDLPQILPRVTEYQGYDVRCPCCQQVTRGTFPEKVRTSIQYGPMLKGIALSLLYGHLLPYARTAELLADVC